LKFFFKFFIAFHDGLRIFVATSAGRSYKTSMRKSWSFLVVLVLIVIVAGYVCINYYSYVFAHTIKGQIVAVERVNENTTILSGRTIDPSQLFSFAIAIKGLDGEIATASSEDRQWAVAQKGQCAEAKFYPYPPWDLDKGGTYYNARLIRLFDCPGSLSK
jgi:hypothetical protein